MFSGYFAVFEIILSRCVYLSLLILKDLSVVAAFNLYNKFLSCVFLFFSLSGVKMAMPILCTALIIFSLNKTFPDQNKTKIKRSLLQKLCTYSLDFCRALSVSLCAVYLKARTL